MKLPTTLVLLDQHHRALYQHLYPGDGKEAAAILLCASTASTRERLLVRDFLLVPHEACHRERDALRWPGQWLESAIELGEQDDLTILLLHSHPGDLYEFSMVDDASDRIAVDALLAAYGHQHGSAIMTPDGAILARLYSPGMRERPIELVTSAGGDLRYWWHHQSICTGQRHRPMAFTGEMRHELQGLTAVVVGASGTGSIVIEQLARLGFGRLILIDFDHIERRNLNRILNAMLKDAREKRLKVDVLADAIMEYRENCVVVKVPKTICSRDAVLAAAQGDIVFSCVDTHHARWIVDHLGAAFLLPIVDMGVTIPTRRTESGAVAIGDVVGRVDYVFPGGSTLADRQVYTPASLRAEELRDSNPAAFRQELAAGYIKGFHEEAPSVISLNMRAAGDAVNEFLARAYPFRHDGNERYARAIFSLAAGETDYVSEMEFFRAPNPILCRGDTEPLLGLLMLADQIKAKAA